MPYSAKVLQGEWRKEWQDMPEFEQEDLAPHRTVFVHFRNDADVEEFEKLIGQKLTPKQKAVWFPPKDKKTYVDKRYVDE